jgi:hypothetical protein
MNLRREKKDKCLIDLKNAVNSSADNFTVKLMQLMFKADLSNFAKLRSVYPDIADAVDRYKKGEIHIDQPKSLPEGWTALKSPILYPKINES